MVDPVLHAALNDVRLPSSTTLFALLAGPTTHFYPHLYPLPYGYLPYFIGGWPVHRYPKPSNDPTKRVEAKGLFHNVNIFELFLWLGVESDIEEFLLIASTPNTQAEARPLYPRALCPVTPKPEHLLPEVTYSGYHYHGNAHVSSLVTSISPEHTGLCAELVRHRPDLKRDRQKAAVKWVTDRLSNKTRVDYNSMAKAMARLDFYDVRPHLQKATASRQVFYLCLPNPTAEDIQAGLTAIISVPQRVEEIMPWMVRCPTSEEWITFLTTLRKRTGLAEMLHGLPQPLLESVTQEEVMPHLRLALSTYLSDPRITTCTKPHKGRKAMATIDPTACGRLWVVAAEQILHAREVFTALAARAEALVPEPELRLAALLLADEQSEPPRHLRHADSLRLWAEGRFPKQLEMSGLIAEARGELSSRQYLLSPYATEIKVG